MKMLMFAAALSISGIALAQDAGTTTDPTTTAPGAAPADPTATDAPAPSGVTTTDGTVPGDGVTQQGTDPSGVAVAPPGTNEPLQAPPGATIVAPGPEQAAAFTPKPATADYPPCSKTVTDQCVQTYERGVRKSRRR